MNKMDKKANKPSIRFVGFTDAWEWRKLGELCETFCDGDWIESKDQSESGIRLIQTGNVGITEFIDKPAMHKWISTKTFETLRCNEVIPGDILISRLPDPAGRACIVPVLNSRCITAVDCTIARPGKSCLSQYLVQYLASNRYFKEVEICLAGGTRQRISRSNLASFFIPFAHETKEQEKIAFFFEHLDTLITLHQRKYDKLVNLKKSMLEKMFPQHGADVPEIRFAGFTNVWKQRRLKEISNKVIEKNTSRAHRETFTNSAEFGIISQRDYFDHDISNVENLGNYYMVRDDDFVYNPRISTTAPVGPINRNKLGRIGVMSPLYTVFRTHDIDRTYLEYFFKSLYWHSYMKLNGDSGARSDRFSIKDSVFIEMPIPYPKIKEQEKIGKYLTHLDTLITLHQRKLEKLQNIKKSCLEKMFV